MKSLKATAIALSLLPLYGCASVSDLFGPEPTTPTTPVKAAAQVQAPNGPQDVDSAILEAQNARKRGDLSKAAHILSQLVLVSSDDPRVVAEYGKTLAAQGRSDDAMAFLERATQLSPSDWSLYSALGIAYDQKGNYQAAQSLYDRALALKPGEPSVLNNAALSHMQAGDLDGAEKLLRQAEPGSPNYPRIAQNLALLEKLKAAQPPKPAGETPVSPAATAAAAESAAPAGPSAPPATISALPPASPEPAMGADSTAADPPAVAAAENAAIAPPKDLITTAALEAPPVPERPTNGPAPLDLAKAGPTLRGQVPSKDELDAAHRDVPAKPAAVKVVSAAAPMPKPASAPSEATPHPAKPAAQAHVAVNGTYYVQAGAFNSADRAGLAVAGLEQLGARVMPGTSHGRPIFRVRIGPFRNAAQAQTAIEQVQALGRKDVLIVKETQQVASGE